MKFLTVLFSIMVCLASKAEDKPRNCQHDEATLRCCKVIKVYDGDTLTVDCPNLPAIFGSKLGVRIEGIDTAERRPALDQRTGTVAT